MVDYTVAPSMTARNCLLKRAQRETLRWGRNSTMKIETERDLY